MIETPGLVHLLDAGEHLVLEHRREAGARLVEQQHARLHHQGAAHRQHLALAAGQRPGPLRRSARRGAGTSRRRTSIRSREVALAQVAAHLEVLPDGQRREHVVDLRHVADALGHERVRLLAGDVLAPVHHGALADRDQAEQRLQHRRLAGTVRADDADQLTVGQLEAAPVEDVDLRDVAGDHVVDVDQQRAAGRSRPQHRPVTHRPAPPSGRRRPGLSASSAAISAASSSAVSASRDLELGGVGHVTGEDLLGERGVRRAEVGVDHRLVRRRSRRAGPSAMISPSAITTTQSLMSRTTSMSCSTNTHRDALRAQPLHVAEQRSGSAPGSRRPSARRA